MHIEINDINTIEQLNTVQINIDPETGAEITTDNRNARSTGLTTVGTT